MKISRKELGVFSFLLAFLIVLYLISGGYNLLERVDISINSAILYIHNDFFSLMAEVFALIFDSYSLLIVSAVISVILFFKKYKKEAVLFLSTMIVNSGVIYLLKEIVGRDRPLNGLVLESGFAFPSGHATTCVVFFGLLCYLTFRSNKSRNFKILTLLASSLLVLLIGFSRLYLNVHWFSDVLGGFLLGGFILFLGISVKEIFD